MHQPQYCDLVSGSYQLPWVYLHAIKDYSDMAAHLEAHPNARAVVNFTPVLLQQIGAYAEEVGAYLKSGTSLNDPLLAALADPVLPASMDSRLELVKKCLHANKHRVIDRFASYRVLAEMADAILERPDLMLYVSEQFLADLLVWFHLGWMGESVRRSDKRIAELQNKARGYSVQDRRLLLQVMGEILDDVLPRYQALAKRGQVELSTSPQDHPILPLLLNINTARDALPSINLPMVAHYPGGADRVRWHLERARTTFTEVFSLSPLGCWPPEGAVSNATFDALADAGFAWTASGQGVLLNSLRQAGIDETSVRIHQPYLVGERGLPCFFRSDELSDLIGFTYSDWKSEDAVGDFIHRVLRIQADCKDHLNPVVSIILDGENAWEYFPENGFEFLDCLYTRLADHPSIKLTTFGDYLAKVNTIATLHDVVSGSWVYGNLATWVGDPAKNRAWELLAEVKGVVDRALARGLVDPQTERRVHAQLGVCEASDWFWWLGDYNPPEAVAQFDQLFRHNIANLYAMLGEIPPQHLTVPLSIGSGEPEHGGTMRRGQ